MTNELRELTEAATKAAIAGNTEAQDWLEILSEEEWEAWITELTD